MAKMQLQADHQPLALTLQVHDGGLVEAVLTCEVEIEGHTFSRDIWWKDMSDDARKLASSLIKDSLKEILGE